MWYLASLRYLDDGNIVEISLSSKHPLFLPSTGWKSNDVDSDIPPNVHVETTVVQLRHSCPRNLFILSWRERMQHDRRWHLYTKHEDFQGRAESASSSISRQHSSLSVSSWTRKRQHSPPASLNINGVQLAYVEDSSSSSEEEEEEEEVLSAVDKCGMEIEGDETTISTNFFPYHVPSHGGVLKLPQEFIFESSFDGGREGTCSQSILFHDLIEDLEAGTKFLQEGKKTWLPVPLDSENEKMEHFSLASFFSCNFLFLGYNEKNSTILLLPDPILCTVGEDKEKVLKNNERRAYGFYPLPLVSVSQDDFFLLLHPFAKEVISGPKGLPYRGALVQKSTQCIRVPISSPSALDLESKMALVNSSYCTPRTLQSPFLNVDLLPSVFHVIPEREYYLFSMNCHVVFIGVCSGLPWVQYRDTTASESSKGKPSLPFGFSPAVPLALCYQEADLRNRYGLREGNVSSLAPADSAPITTVGETERISSIAVTNALENSVISLSSSSLPPTSFGIAPPMGTSEDPSGTVSPTGVPLRGSPSPLPSSTMLGSYTTPQHDSVAPRSSIPCPRAYQTPSAAHPVVTVTGPYGTPIHCQKDARRLYGVAFPDRVVGREGGSGEVAAWRQLILTFPQRGRYPEAPRALSLSTSGNSSAISDGVEATVMGLYHHDLVLLFDGQEKSCFLRSGTSREQFLKAFSLVRTNSPSELPTPSLSRPQSPPEDRSTADRERKNVFGVVLEARNKEVEAEDVAEEERHSAETIPPSSKVDLAEENAMLLSEHPNEIEQVQCEAAIKESSSGDAQDIRSMKDSPVCPQMSSEGNSEAKELQSSSDAPRVQSLMSPDRLVSGVATPLINFMKGYAAMKLERESVSEGILCTRRKTLTELMQFYRCSLDHLLEAYDRYTYYSQHDVSYVCFFAGHTAEEIKAFLLLHEE